MAQFEIVSKYEGLGINFPNRKTRFAAGYDFEVAEDTIIPPLGMMGSMMQQAIFQEAAQGITLLNQDQEMIEIKPKTLDEMADLTKQLGTRLTLVPTGIKVQLAEDEFLALNIRSSSPLKYYLALANGTGIIDADYYNNADNEGEIFFQVINFSPVEIQLKKGDIIGQGIIQKYYTVDGDIGGGQRTGGFGSTNG